MNTTRGHRAPRYCPAGCGRVVRAEMPLCVVHWREVPRELRQTVNRAWTAWRRGSMDDAAWRTYMDARAAALQSIGVQP